MNECIYVLEYMQENYVKQEKETDEKILKLKKKCKRYQKMLPDNICYDKCYGCHGIWFEGKGPKRCEQCKERWCNDCEGEHKDYEDCEGEYKDYEESEEENV